MVFCSGLWCFTGFLLRHEGFLLGFGRVYVRALGFCRIVIKALGFCRVFARALGFDRVFVRA